MKKWFKIKAFAFSRKDVIRELSDNRSQRFMDHAIKIILTKGKQRFKHWTDEMFSFCEWIQDIPMKINKNTTLIPENLILQYYFAGLELESQFINKLNRYAKMFNYGEIRNTINDNITYYNYRQFCNEMARKLSKNEIDPDVIRSLAQQYLINKQNYK